MTITPTALLSLPIITTGTESGTWGDVVDNGLTSYLDIAIAGGLAITITTADVTLANTAGTSSATGITSTTAQYAILNISGAKTAARNLILPSSSREYTINNAGSGGYLLTVKGSATTGITLVDGEKAVVAWNGTDYVKISSSVVSNSTGTLLLANGGTSATSAPAAMASLMGFTTTATAAGTTTLTNTSSFYQIFTGSTTQTVVLPVVSTLATGWTFHICNNSTGSLTVNSSGGNALITILPGTTAMCTCILITGTTAASWEAGLTDFSTATGTGSVVLGTSPTIDSATLTGTNTIQGLTVGLGPSALSGNTVLGANAANANNSGGSNTVIGSSALFSATAITGAVAVGISALGSSSAGDYNTAIGNGAGYGSYGSNNTYLGYNSGYTMTTGANNVIIGSFQGGTSPISGSGSGWVVVSNGSAAVQLAIDSTGVATFPRGPVVVYTPTPGSSITTTATLTNADIQTQIINTTGSSYTVTMPTQTTLNSLVSVWVGTYDIGYDFYIINTASGTITIAGNTGVTTLGTMTIATGVSARFRIRKTLASGYVVYRLA
jgi:hypothetical protein